MAFFPLKRVAKTAFFAYNGKKKPTFFCEVTGLTDTTKRKRGAVLILSLLLIAVFTYLGGLCFSIGRTWLKILLLVLVNYANAAVALIAMKITGVKPEFDLKNVRQYGIGVAIAIILSLAIAFVPALCGFSLVGQHSDFSWFRIVYGFLFYFLVVGPVEELIFRVYLQDTLTSFFIKRKYLGVILAALLFGLSHLINGSLVQVPFTFGIGLVFGTCRYKIRDCKYPGLAVGHGLYDFLNEIVRIFIV